ncbi:hypothetical protein WKR88_08175 [Trinickia caryophylli]|uniref:Uncharacterized protein n=1 Tax=Trinickia caryophylli TaxID=28094 RepID=A0A1X7EFM3_TRICW|nr:hypothetical protein [Trinickia caryophylli]PMS11095.1 hypothetical protein C0Z17_16535 [Trinickia caryophylli]TRX14550.1 hypothetical protein FNF07_25160 [Trinickia caryophylli]WQE14388.1 hypothetical protein U0034_27350 [Trinickia caryophylli]SMF33156.1 hypothetical protein SAMN06295900_105330 [Trinickia caryophylli]GLU32214.1 hypothetical protein Busp01_20560 [Trinickia caryophylli]
MKYVLRAVIVMVLTYIYLKLIYSWQWVDDLRKSPVGQKVYFFLAGLFNVQGADEGETLLLLFYFFVALVVACLTVCAAFRFVVRPYLGGPAKRPHR